MLTEKTRTHLMSNHLLRAREARGGGGGTNARNTLPTLAVCTDDESRSDSTFVVCVKGTHTP